LTNWIGLWKAQWDANFSSVLAHFWSLGVEEQFYFFWLLVVWMARPRAIPWIAATLAGLSFVVRFAWAAHIGVQMMVPPISVEILLATICKLDGLFIGALCAYFFRDAKIMLRIRSWLPWVATMCIGLFFLTFSLMLFLPRPAEMLFYGAYPAVPHSLDDAVRFFLACGGSTCWLWDLAR
jgi:peptidoglycan/LPS O-acetylase OafA/YrhL